MTDSEKLLDVTGLSNGNVTKIATLSTSLHDLNPDYGCLAGNPFEEDGAVDRYLYTQRIYITWWCEDMNVIFE